MTSDKPKNISLSRQQELMNAFDFTLHDLAANRDGRITEVQKKKVMRLQGDIWNSTIIFLLLVPFSAFVLLFCSVFFIGLRLNEMKHIVVVFLSIFGVLSVIISPFLIWFWNQKLRLWKDLQTEIVKTLQGITIVETDPRGLVGSVTVHDVRMQAKKECILRIKHLEPHVIHYLPNSKVIVSVEVMEQ